MYSQDSRKKIAFLFSDIIALAITYLILASLNDFIFFKSKFFITIFLAFVILVGILTDEYSKVTNNGYLKEFQASLSYGVKNVIIFSFVLVLGKNRFLTDISQLSIFFLSELFILTTILVFFVRILMKSLSKGHLDDIKNVLLLTSITNGHQLKTILEENNYQVVAYVNKSELQDSSIPVLSSISDIRDFIANNQVDEIFVDKDARAEYIEAINYFKLLGISTTVSIGDFSDLYLADSVIKKLGNMTFVTTAINIVKTRQVILKRIIDILGSIVGIILMIVVALVIAPIVKKQSPGPLIFKQKRVGKNGKIFDIYKFRSMYTDAEERKKELMEQNDLDTNLMFKMENDPRIFPFGQKIRDWSIDELPQFINVLKGDMSLVGTRPPTLDEYKEYESHHFKRLATKPGITGLWQVSGRSDITDFEDVVALDMKYIQTWSITQDIMIIFKTVGVVLKREGSR